MLFVSVSRPNRTFGYGLGGRGGRNHVAGGVDLLQIRIEDYFVQSVRLPWTWTGLLHQDRSGKRSNASGTRFSSVNFSESFLRANEKRFQRSGKLFLVHLVYLFLLRHALRTHGMFINICNYRLLCFRWYTDRSKFFYLEIRLAFYV